AIGGVLRPDDAVVRATSFWEFPIRTLYREFPESRAFRSPQSPCRHAVDRGLGSGSELQELAGGTLDFETLIVVRDRPRMRGGGDRHVPQGLDRPLLFDQVDGLDRLHHALTEPLGRKASRSSWTRFSRAASIALITGWADPSSYSLRTGATSSSQRSGAPFVWRMRTSVYWSAPHTMRFAQT